MKPNAYRFTFSDEIPFKRAEECICLATLAAEGLCGRSTVRLDATFRLDGKRRCCVVDADTEIGRNIARIFTGLLTQEFGEEAFRVGRVSRASEADNE